MDNVWMRAALQNANKNKRTRERAWMACQSDKQTDTTVFAIVFMLNDREGRSDLSSHRIASHCIASIASNRSGDGISCLVVVGSRRRQVRASDRRGWAYR